MASLTPEDQTLLCAAHPVLPPDEQERLAHCFTQPLSWPDLLADAERHGVVALLHRHVVALDALGSSPTHVHERLTLRARTCVAWNLRLRHALGRLLAAFNRAGLAVMPLKGPVLADQLYPDPMLRATADLDLLVRHDDVVAAESLLEGLGYRRLPAREQGADYHTLFISERSEAGSQGVQPHPAPGGTHVSPLGARAVWAPASPTTWPGQPSWAVAGPPLPPYLC